MAETVLKAYDEKWKVAVELDKGGAELRKQQLEKSQKHLSLERERLERQIVQLRATARPPEVKSVGGKDVIDMSPPLRSKSGRHLLLSCLTSLEIPTEIVSYTDKCQLCNAVNGLQDKYMPGVIRIFQEQTPQLLRVCEAESATKLFSQATLS